MARDYVTELPGKAEALADLRPSGGYPSRMQWQPIATAPRGEPVLCAVHLGQSFVLLKNVRGEFVHYPVSYDYKHCELNICESATHWMPLPLPPAQGTEAGTAETERLGPKDDGPVAGSHAPTPSVAEEA